MSQFNVLHEVILIIVHALLSLPWQLLFTGCSLHLQVQTNKVWWLHWRGGSSGSPRLLLPWYKAWHQPSTAPLTGLSAGQVWYTMWVKEICLENLWDKLIIMILQILQHCQKDCILLFLFIFFDKEVICLQLYTVKQNKNIYIMHTEIFVNLNSIYEKKIFYSNKQFYYFRDRIFMTIFYNRKLFLIYFYLQF